MTKHVYWAQILPVISVIMLIVSCAKINSPSGGPRDKEPPVIIKSEPPDRTKNFSGKKFVITFDEFVTLEKINEKFMVSPPMKTKPYIHLKGKSVVTEFEDILRDSTTYTFYFQDAIRDLNEGNTIENFQYVFSTGAVIDSLSITGNVYNSHNLEPPEDVLVLLYGELADSAIRKMLPAYISRVDKKGYFRIDNLREGSYRLYALKDIDNSKSFNVPGEEIAFMDSVIHISSERNYLPVVKDTTLSERIAGDLPDTVYLKGEYSLFLFLPEKKMHYLTSSSRGMPYKLSYTLSLPPGDMGFDFSIPDAEEGSYFIERSRDNDSIQVWLTDSSLYSNPQISPVISYPFTDTTGTTIQKKDTILMRFLMPRPTRGKPKPVVFKVSSGLSAGSLKPGQSILFKSQTPFRQPDTSKIKLYETKGTERLKIPFSLSKDSLNSCEIRMKANLEQGKNYLFVADSASFGNIYGERSDSTGYRFSVRTNENYGSLILNIKNYEGSRIVQLLTGDEKLVREIPQEKDGKVEFQMVDKGDYRVRVIYDLNGDGKWTTGDLDSLKQPEPVSYLPVEIELKENWDSAFEWDISEMNNKKHRGPVIKDSAVGTGAKGTVRGVPPSQGRTGSSGNLMR